MTPSIGGVMTHNDSKKLLGVQMLLLWLAKRVSEQCGIRKLCGSGLQPPKPQT